MVGELDAQSLRRIRHLSASLSGCSTVKRRIFQSSARRADVEGFGFAEGDNGISFASRSSMVSWLTSSFPLAAAIMVPMLVVGGCTAQPLPPGEGTGGQGDSGGNSMTGGARGSGGNSANGGEGAGQVPAEETTLLGARVRRLTNAEYDATVRSILGIDVRPSQSFNQDVRKSGYARNETQVVDAILAGQYQEAARQLAEQAVTENYEGLVPCGAQDDTCAEEFVDTFGPRAYRGAFDDEQRSRLLTVFQVGSDDGGFESGVQLVIEAALQSPFFLYHLELGGDADKDGTVVLKQHEIANSLAYLITGAPPDKQLLTAAEAGELLDPDVRVSHARRLLKTPAARVQVRRMIIEWLGLNGFQNKGKDSTVYPDFLDYRASMIQETNDFVEEVAFHRDGTLRTLLSAEFSVVDESMAEFYGLPESGNVSLAPIERRGVLNHASWLSATAHGDDSGPVIRGLKLLTKVLCANVPGHAQLGIAAPFPPNDGETSARQRIEDHATEPACNSCHKVIDQAGFTFENYDGMGRLRTEDNGVPVDTMGALSSDASQWGVEETSGTFKNSQELIEVLKESPDMRRCFVKNVARFATATRVKDIEDDFEESERAWSQDTGGDMRELFVAFVRDSSFAYRSTTPPQTTFIDDIFQ